MKTCGDGCGGSITSEHVAFQHSCVFVSRHVGKVPEAQTEDTQVSSHTSSLKLMNQTLCSVEESLIMFYQVGDFLHISANFVFIISPSEYHN